MSRVSLDLMSSGSARKVVYTWGSWDSWPGSTWERADLLIEKGLEVTERGHYYRTWMSLGVLFQEGV